MDPFAENTIPSHTPRYFQVRRMFGGRFTLVKPLGKGGMGVVWLAHDNELAVHRALKFAPPEIAAEARSAAMLKREVLAGTSLAHVNGSIPRVVKTGWWLVGLMLQHEGISTKTNQPP